MALAFFYEEKIKVDFNLIFLSPFLKKVRGEKKKSAINLSNCVKNLFINLLNPDAVATHVRTHY